MSGSEKVLCIQRKLLPDSWVMPRTVLPMTMEEFTAQCSCSGFSFVPRSRAEEDPGLKQIIPYILIQTRDGAGTAAYNRQGSEARLHDLWSVGIGGHINPRDRENGQAGFEKILISGMERELTEEILARPQEDRPEFLGIISEEITPVGQVHMGAVFIIRTRAPENYRPGPELTAFQWMKTARLDTLNLELWSELALELIRPGLD